MKWAHLRTNKPFVIPACAYKITTSQTLYYMQRNYCEYNSFTIYILCNAYNRLYDPFQSECTVLYTIILESNTLFFYKEPFRFLKLVFCPVEYLFCCQQPIPDILLRNNKKKGNCKKVVDGLFCQHTQVYWWVEENLNKK